MWKSASSQKRAQEDIWSWLHYLLTAGCLLASFCLCFISPPLSAVSVRPPLFSASPCLHLFQRFSFQGLLIPLHCLQHCCTSSNTFSTEVIREGGLTWQGLWWFCCWGMMTNLSPGVTHLLWRFGLISALNAHQGERAKSDSSCKAINSCHLKVGTLMALFSDITILDMYETMT